MKPFNLKFKQLNLEIVKIFPARSGDMILIDNSDTTEYYPVSYKMYGRDNLTQMFHEILCYNEGDNGEINYISMTNGDLNGHVKGEAFFCNYNDYLNICGLVGKEKLRFNDYVQAVIKHEITIPYIDKNEK